MKSFRKTELYTTDPQENQLLIQSPGGDPQRKMLVIVIKFKTIRSQRFHAITGALGMLEKKITRKLSFHLNSRSSETTTKEIRTSQEGKEMMSQGD